MSFLHLLLLILILFDNDIIGSNQCLCLPKAQLNTKNSTVEFLVFNSIHYKKGDTFNIEDRVEYDVICGWPRRNKIGAIYQIF